jgi:hypothetical protein
MGKFNDHITDEHISFIKKQKIFFVATAPLSAEGHINISPKGLDTFKVISPNQVAYLDFVGSGNETSAHLLENGRITFMFCAFTGKPKILRLYGKGYTVLPSDEQWGYLRRHFRHYSNARQFIVADVYQTQTSCGFAVPLYQYTGDRNIMFEWAEKKGPGGLEKYKRENNFRSIDGLPSALGEQQKPFLMGD